MPCHSWTALLIQTFDHHLPWEGLLREKEKPMVAYVPQRGGGGGLTAVSIHRDGVFCGSVCSRDVTKQYALFSPGCLPAKM